MKKWILSLSLAAGVIGLSACNQDGGDSAAVVESKAGNITQEELYNSMKEKHGEQALQELVFEKVLSDKYEVSDKEINKKVEEVKEQLGPNYEQALAQYGYEGDEDLKRMFKIGLLQEKAAMKDVKVTDKELQEAYDNYRTDIRASHILVEDEAKAKELKAQLDGGAKMADLAKEHSTDPGSKEKGGDLDWFGPGKMVPEFEEAAYALEVNQISEPVQTQNGWHIIQLTDKKEKEPFEDMKKELETEVKRSKIDQAAIQKAMERELKAADVEIKDKDLESILDTPEAPPAQG
ncbi:MULTISPECIES: peptidylprolyl isomerase [Bacillus]|uniref:peptidylprolyl isomerase n=1 Tax=Bacillus TaxID=1386 RepID=UPI000C765E50|nr:MULTISPECIES: peptidylprolyl isomerase [Bacillus]PLR86675.1 peptidylprolyl isomerase [Bacillus sp. V33-4]RSK44901.1 peptidylprolyl isomerase [Bacillus canaveralius]